MATINFERFSKLPALQGFSQQEMISLFQLANKQRYHPGETIIRAGEPATCFYIVASGQILMAAQHGPTLHPLAQMGQGNLFGELPFIYRYPNHAVTVMALQLTSLFSIKYTDFDRLMRQFPELAAKFGHNVTRNISLKPHAIQNKASNRDILRKAEIFAGLTDEHLDQLQSIAIPISYKQGEPIMESGDAAQGFYMLLEGEVEVRSADGGSRLALLGAGQVLGEMELVYKKNTRIASVVALSPVRLWYFPLEDYHRLLSVVPEMSRRLRSSLGKVAARRSWSMPTTDETQP